MIEISQKAFQYTINLKCLKIGKDYQVLIMGGREHIGAIALGAVLFLAGTVRYRKGGKDKG